MSQTKASTNKANKNAHNNSHGSSGSISSHNNGEKRLNSSASSSNVVGRAGNNPLIPMSRVKTIMKSSPEISSVNADTLFLVCKATEAFIQQFAIEAHKMALADQATSKDDRDKLTYHMLAKLVSGDERFQFLAEIVPFKVKAKEALRQIQQHMEQQNK